MFEDDPHAQSQDAINHTEDRRRRPCAFKAKQSNQERNQDAGEYDYKKPQRNPRHPDSLQHFIGTTLCGRKIGYASPL
jgi:hypothetical protein